MTINLNNQRGFSPILAVMILSVCVLIFFTATSSLLTYRGKSYTRVKEAMNIIDVMEQASKAVRSSWDQGAVLAGPTPTPNQIAAAMPPLTPDPACVTTCQGLYGGATPALCYTVTTGGAPYCLYGTQTLTNAKLELKIRSPEDLLKQTTIERFEYVAGSYLDSFLRQAKVNFSIGETKAHAGSRVDDVGMIPPTCTATLAGCLTCGPGTGAICGMIYACPLAFSGCSTYTGGTNAVFAQEFYITPPGSIQ